ncbi:hypothetical protein [Mycobacteroides abscessus]|uniref:hypothetical protein n=1 Tax=Mycobacteroides abscessus TaxID=36809 RepID=UPI0009A87367|nr:hypothetical protein [Mycobacteroides abscessus]SKG34591.1 Uncharacterised protein [Mycobacteroides abscessus subsp. bolletii]SKG51557.1 Uncharacterised protein [Mycobacteroides abscessus subsp. bolletii]SKH55953.1 Uncharacterised protein [Mycobacteroides abscessus subsp. bolletii]SKH69514.1 Uncharacterised protein [Mycobacteroides abscessus subsp. bolletii]SKH69532.1 Uncharacterised protein [Mycobacteroides abscessus subsp. bolletii]
MKDPLCGTWSTVYGQLRHLQLSDALHDLAAEWARRALEEPAQGESGLDAAIRLAAVGQAGELLIKSTLAGISPVLLADKANVMTLLKLTDNEPHGAQGKMTTAGAVDALRRLNECRPPSTQKIDEPKLIFDVRNDVIHMGLTPSDAALESALTELVILIEQVFAVRAALGQTDDWNKFWSEKHIRIVEARKRKRHRQLVWRLNDLLANARKAYGRLTLDLSRHARERLIAELTARIPTVDEGTQIVRRHICPACDNTMWVIYDVNREVSLDDSEMPSGGSSIPHGYSLMVQLDAHVRSAECPVCGLFLDQNELALTNIPFTLDLGYSEASDNEEQAWRDAKNAEYEADFDDFDDWDGDERTTS